MEEQGEEAAAKPVSAFASLLGLGPKAKPAEVLSYTLLPLCISGPLEGCGPSSLPPSVSLLGFWAYDHMAEGPWHDQGHTGIDILDRLLSSKCPEAILSSTPLYCKTF